jgi:hypothetical protein
VVLFKGFADAFHRAQLLANGAVMISRSTFSTAELLVPSSVSKVKGTVQAVGAQIEGLVLHKRIGGLRD